MTYKIHQGSALDILRQMPDESVQCCVTSPPYFQLRNYGIEGQIGLEETPAEFVASLVAVFEEVKRVLKPDGTCWINLGDSYWGSGKGLNPDGTHSSVNSPTDKQFTNKGSLKTKVAKYRDDLGLKAKDLIGIPWRVAFALQDAGWYLRQDIIWSKPNPMPESVTDRCTKAHEYIFLLTKSARYLCDMEAIREKQVSNRPDMAANGIRTGLAYLDQGSAPSNHERSSWKGSEFHTGKTAVHQLGRSSKNRDRTVGNRNGEGASTLDKKKHRKPAGWDTGDGSHGTIHRTGRAEEVEYPEVERTDRNKRSVWTVPTQPMPEAHFATFPEKLIEPCILAGSREGDIVLDPFSGAATTGLVSLKHRREYIGIEINPEYIAISERRLKDVQVKLF